MKKITAFLAIIVFASCTSIKYQNAHLNDLIAVEKLKSDTDLTLKKLKDLHPKLYWYISEKDLNFKFDSLKNTITSPMTSFEFYKKLNPVVGAVREGHTYLIPPTKLYTKKQNEATTKKGISPLSQFEFELFNGKMYVVKNKSYDKSIKIGTEVVAINGKKTQEYLEKYNNHLASDGFIESSRIYRLSKNFKTNFFYENGLKDTINYNFKFNDSIKNIAIFRKVVDTAGTGKQKKKVLTDLQKAENKAIAKALKVKKDIYGYDKITKEYNRDLRFIEKDSSVAIIKIKGFQKGDYETFYEESFEKIKKNNSKTLIIDLRNNGGGRLAEIINLYGYLADSTFIFTQDSPVVSKTSLFRADYIKGSSWYWKPFKIASVPIVYPFAYFMAHKKEDGNYYISSSKPKKIKENNFKGKVYVLINGGCFSASSIISSNLKGSKRATFVGQETGGAYNGTVAGLMPLEKIPNSKLQLRVGLIGCIPFYQTEKEGRGIFPDKEIFPTLQDRIDGIDPELNWVLEDLKKNNSHDN